MIDAETVILRFEDAGRVLLALPTSGHGTQMRTMHLEWVRSAEHVAETRFRRMAPPVPDPAAIDLMDATYRWLGLLPADRYVLRRVLGARSLVDPVNDRHLFTWRRLGKALGADHKAVQRWHCQGIDLLVDVLNGARRQAA